MLSNRSLRMGACAAAVLITYIASQAQTYTPLPLKMTYSVELGGDNFAADWKAGTRKLYTGNSPDTNVAYKDDLVNWAVLLKVEGDHLAADENYYRVYGAANTVFNLELRQGSEDGPLVSNAFLSTINNGTNGDPQAAAAFAASYTVLSTQYPAGRLIDKVTANGPRMEPIFTYPYYDPAESKLIGMGAGYKEWIRSGSDLNRITFPGIGMTLMPTQTIQNGVGGLRAGLGVKPIAEGQIDMSNLPTGTYVLKVTPGKGNNVLRGDLDLLQNTNRPAFALGVPEEQTFGGTLTFELVEGSAPTPGVKGRYVFYNNSAWDGNTPGISVPAEYNAICYEKKPLLPGMTATCENYINYSKGINGIIIDARNFNRLPEYEVDLICLYANSHDDPFTWPNIVPAPTMMLRPGEGVNGSDRLILTWPDNTIPNSNWLLVALLADDPDLGIPADDYFIFGLAIGEANCDFLVGPADELKIRSNPKTIVTPATVCDPHDVNRDKKVDGADQLRARSNPTTAVTRLKTITWAPL